MLQLIWFCSPFCSPFIFITFQKDSLESIDGFVTPSADAFNPDNVGPSKTTPTKFDIPAIPVLPSGHTGGVGGLTTRTLPGRGKLMSTLGNSTSVLNCSLPRIPGGAVGGAKSSAVSPRASIISTDSGIGTSVGGEVCRPPQHKNGSTSVPNSGSGMFNRADEGRDDDEGSSSSSGPHSADSEFRHRITVSFCLLPFSYSPSSLLLGAWVVPQTP